MALSPARPSYEARCGRCRAPAVIPRRDAERLIEESSKPTYTWFCRCGEMSTALIIKLEKARPEPRPRAPLRRRRKPSRTKLSLRLGNAWANAARRHSCAKCGRKGDWKRGIIIEGHHIVRQALLRAQAKALGWTQEQLDRRTWDLRNLLPLCGDCHAGHHSGLRRLSWSLVHREAPKVEQFAREVELMSLARREYE